VRKQGLAFNIERGKKMKINNEALYNAIGQISDSDIALAGRYRKSAAHSSGVIAPVRKSRRFAKMKVLAASLAAALALTISVGAFNDWDYSSLFGMMFSNSGDDELHELAHTIRPETQNMVNPFDNIEVDVLGITGDAQTLHMIIEVKLNNRYRLKVEDYHLGLQAFTREGENERFSDFAIMQTGLQILSQNRNRVILSATYNFMSYEGGVFTPGRGVAHMAFYKGEMFRMAQNDRDDVIFFDVPVELDFAATRTFEVGEYSNMPLWGTVGTHPVLAFGEGETTPVLLLSAEITPLSVRFETKGQNLGDYDFGAAVRIVFKDGSVMYSRNDSSSGSGSRCPQDENASYTVNFRRPFSLDSVYSVTIGDIELFM
jgi:hypothetical protein